MTLSLVFVLQRLNKLIMPDIEERKGDHEHLSKNDHEKYASYGSVTTAASAF